MNAFVTNSSKITRQTFAKVRSKVSDTQCFQLIECSRLSANYYEPMDIGVTTVNNRIQIFNI